MKILRCYLFLPPLPGGLENHVKYLSLMQSSCKDYAVCIAYNQGEFVDSLSFPILPKLNLKRIRPQVVRDLFFYTALGIKMKLKNNDEFDVLHIHGDWSAFLSGRVISSVFNIPVLVGSVHGKLRRNKFWEYIYKIALRNYSFIYCTGMSEASYLKSLGFNNIYWQPSGVRKEFYTKSHNAIKYDVISIGSLLPVKNYDLLLDIAKLIPKHSFVIVGQGIQESYLKQRCLNENILNIEFIKSLSPFQLSELMDQCRVFLSTSLSEGTPTVFLEALVKGLPVITTPSNDYSKVIYNGHNGYITDFNAFNIASTIIEILDNEEVYHKLQTSTLARAETFSWQSVSNRISSLMEVYTNVYK